MATTRAYGALGCSRVAFRHSVSYISAGQQESMSAFNRPRSLHNSPRRLQEKVQESEAGSELIESTRSSDAKESDFAFAFDIDGVLYRGAEPVKGAAGVLRTLRKMGHRYVFLTNGGGTQTESAKTKALARRLGIKPEEQLVSNRMVLSHSPLMSMSQDIKDNDTVLITSQAPHAARTVAEMYGFKNVVTPADVGVACPTIYPFMSPTELGNKNGWNTVRRAAEGKQIFEKIDHIFVWNDPRDWSLDIQIIFDALVSRNGYIGTYSSKNGDTSLPNSGWQQDGQPTLWISNVDLFWKTSYPINRFGTGAFVEALKAVWSAATNGAELKYTALGKPTTVTYDYAHEKLLRLGQTRRPSTYAFGQGPSSPLKTVYMIGDNPESDIRGANEFKPKDGTLWKSILVRTGVWASTKAEPNPKYEPDAIVDDVVDAVRWALKDQGIEMSREEVIKAEPVALAESFAVKGKKNGIGEGSAMPVAPMGRIVA